MRHLPTLSIGHEPRAVGQLRLAAFVRVVAAICLFTLASQVRLPFVGTPVPFTLQPQAVLLVAATLGPHEGLAAVLVWLLLGASGAPVFASHMPGTWALVGPTGGYLASYLPVAYVVGRFGRAYGPAAAMVWMAGVVCTLGLGGAWLSHFVGMASAWRLGVLPFIATDACKAGAVFLTRRLLGDLWRRIF